MAYDQNNSILRIRYRTEKAKAWDGRIVDRVILNPVGVLESSDGNISFVTINFSELGFGGLDAALPKSAAAGDSSNVDSGDGPILVLEGGDSRTQGVNESPFQQLHQIIDPTWPW